MRTFFKRMLINYGISFLLNYCEFIICTERILPHESPHRQLLLLLAKMSIGVGQLLKCCHFFAIKNFPSKLPSSQENLLPPLPAVRAQTFLSSEFNSTSSSSFGANENYRVSRSEVEDTTFCAFRRKLLVNLLVTLANG